VGRGGRTRGRSRRRFGRCSVRIVVHLHRTLTKEEAIRKPIIGEMIREHTGPELRERRDEGTLFSEVSIITSTSCSSSVRPSVAAAGKGDPGYGNAGDK